jgi:protein tyrosine phosphatase (PTP) superfamily phosphohydrolase (DUF442 family)
VPVEDSFNFRRVSDTVTTSGSLTAEQLATLQEDGYEVVVNLLPEGGHGAVADEADIVRAQRVGYVHIPVDFAAPTHDDLEAFVAAMDEHEGETVHVHCAANYRVSAFYGVYAVRKGWWTPDDADAHVRGLWDPAEHPAWAAFLATEHARPAG